MQKEGGPIGQRPTMAASRIVMIDFFENYEMILLRSELRINLLKVYVDDGRQVTTKLNKGMRYNEIEKKFTWNEKAEKATRESKMNQPYQPPPRPPNPNEDQGCDILGEGSSANPTTPPCTLN